MGGDLNASYYGPSVPPQKSYHRHSRGGGGGRGCLCSCGCCIFGMLFRMICSIICTVLVILAVIAVILWFIFRPNVVKFHADGASLTQFNFTGNNTLHYNLALNLTIRNPNKRIGIYYDLIEIRPFYEGQRLDSKTLTPFYQGHKNTSTLTAAFSGQQVVVLSGGGTKEFDKDKTDRVYDIDVKLYLRVRFKFGIFKSPHYKPRIDCGLKVPLSSVNGTNSNYTFKRTRCDFDLF